MAPSPLLLARQDDIRDSPTNLSAVIYLFLKTSPTKLTFFSATAVAVEGLVVGSIIAQATRYIDSFWRTDSPWAVCSVVIGCTLCLAQMALNMWQTYRLIDKAATSLTSIVVADVKANMGVLLLLGVFNFAAAGFFARRAWYLAGKRLSLLVPLALGILSSLGLCLGVVVEGLKLPPLSNNSDYQALLAYQTWLDIDKRLIVVWTGISLAKDILVCGLMTVMLLKSRSDIQRTDRTLLRLLLRLTYETMAGPVVVNIVNLAVIIVQGATFADYSRVVTWIVGPVYFSSILQSLNYRKDVQAVLRLEPAPRPAKSPRRGCKESGATSDREYGSGIIPLTSTDLGNKEMSVALDGATGSDGRSSTLVGSGDYSHYRSRTISDSITGLGETSHALKAMELGRAGLDEKEEEV